MSARTRPAPPRFAPPADDAAGVASTWRGGEREGRGRGEGGFRREGEGHGDVEGDGHGNVERDGHGNVKVDGRGNVQVDGHRDVTVEGNSHSEVDGHGAVRGDDATADAAATVDDGALQLHGVRLALRGRPPLIERLDARVAPGDCLTVMGASGSGKSTLLAFVSGTLAPAFEASGRVVIGATDVTGLVPERRGVGILFQDDLLFPHLSVGANLAFALPASVRPRAARDARIDAALREAGLDGMARRDPATLSGGQRARVALMRALLAGPRVLLLDEPFNKLDARLRQDFGAFVFEHARERALPVLLVTHDEQDARAAGGAVVVVGER